VADGSGFIIRTGAQSPRRFESLRLRTYSGPTEAGNFLHDAGIIGDVDADKEVTRMPWYPLRYFGSSPKYHLLLLEE
jgi:hypothetical protein